jgi:hypothetical protein
MILRSAILNTAGKNQNQRPNNAVKAEKPVLSDFLFGSIRDSAERC